MRIFASSPGWNESGPRTIQSLEPPRDVPISMGKSSSATPTMPMVNLYCASASMLGTSTSTAIMAATERKSQVTWPMASVGASLVTNAMPMPESRKTSGRMAGSASGAKRRVAKCATPNAANSPMGTASDEKLSATFALSRYIAYRRMTGMAAAISRPSSVFLRVLIVLGIVTTHLRTWTHRPTATSRWRLGPNPTLPLPCLP